MTGDNFVLTYVAKTVIVNKVGISSSHSIANGCTLFNTPVDPSQTYLENNEVE